MCVLTLVSANLMNEDPRIHVSLACAKTRIDKGSTFSVFSYRSAHPLSITGCTTHDVLSIHRTGESSW